MVTNPPPVENSKISTIYLSAWFLKYIFSKYPNSNETDPFYKLSRREQVILFSLRQATIALDATYTESSKLEKQKDTSVDQECRQQAICSKNADFLPMKEIESSPINSVQSDQRLYGSLEAGLSI